MFSCKLGTEDWHPNTLGQETYVPGARTGSHGTWAKIKQRIYASSSRVPSQRSLSEVKCTPRRRRCTRSSRGQAPGRLLPPARRRTRHGARLASVSGAAADTRPSRGPPSWEVQLRIRLCTRPRPEGGQRPGTARCSLPPQPPSRRPPIGLCPGPEARPAAP